MSLAHAPPSQVPIKAGSAVNPPATSHLAPEPLIPIIGAGMMIVFMQVMLLGLRTVVCLLCLPRLAVRPGGRDRGCGSPGACSASSCSACASLTFCLLACVVRACRTEFSSACRIEGYQVSHHEVGTAVDAASTSHLPTGSPIPKLNAGMIVVLACRSRASDVWVTYGRLLTLPSPRLSVGHGGRNPAAAAARYPGASSFSPCASPGHGCLLC